MTERPKTGRLRRRLRMKRQPRRRQRRKPRAIRRTVRAAGNGPAGGEPSRCGFVALLGAPNAGKSTLTNNFVGSKVSIVSPKAQTTRTTVKGIGIWGNTQIIFLDTPGIFKPKRRLDRAMVASAWGGVGDADITALVVDAKRGFDDETRAIIAKLKENKIPAVLVLNKVDLVSGETLLQLCAALNDAYAFAETFMVSALNGKGVDDFYDYLAAHLPESPWYYPEEQMSDLPLKLLAAEIVREKLFLYLRQEVPYALTVEPELWERRADNSVRAEMTIYVERDSQKQIVLGRGGTMIKKIGQRRGGSWRAAGRPHPFVFVCQSARELGRRPGKICGLESGLQGLS